MALDLTELTEGERFRAYGNLPYYITSPIVHRLLEHANQLEAAFLVVQLEVAVRMTARPGTRDYGYFPAFTQFYSRPEILLRIPPGAFQPPPKVSSALVALQIPGERERLKIGDEAGFKKFLKTCFAQKRKTLRNNLRSVSSQAEAAAVLQRCGMNQTVRAEELGLAELAQVFQALRQLS
jgi:16S rRNA (adenine1518-N6/adenine1519-N6)-dimethyltransferase